MNVVPNGTGMRALLLTSLALLTLGGPSVVQGQTATDIQVSSTVLQPAVHRLGINLGDNGYWDSGQIMKNLIFENPGFEGLRYRVIFRCTAVTANTCMDDNQYNAQPAGYWNGASYLVLSGSAAGTTGTILSNTAASTCKSCGPTLTFDKSVNLAVGDYFSAVNYFPGTGDAGWADDTSGGGTITTETTDISPNSPGQQAILLSASATGQYAKVTQGFDTWSGLSFIQMNGTFAVTFRAKGVGGNKTLNISALRLQSGVPNWLNQTITLTNAWQDYTLSFTANETGAGLGPIQLNFLAQASSVELDDVSLQQTNSDPTNTTVFRDDVVNALKQLNPGTIRMMAAGAALGSDLPNQLQVPFARYRMGFNADGTSYPNIAYGIHEFLQLCQAVGADPWITIPTATTPAEMTVFIQYLTGTGADPWSTLRISRGQAQPWTAVFNKIHLELGNETWNGSFKGESMNYPAYPQWANQVFGAARQTAGFKASSFDLVLSGLAATPGYNAPMLTYSTQHDSFDVAPYLLFSANDESQALQFGAMFAEPEIFDSAGGEVYNNVAVGAAAPSATGKTTAVSVYETNLGTMIGNITKPELDNLTPSIGAGIAHTEHMLQMMRIGIQYQNAFALPQYEYRRSDGSLTRLWGLVVDMGTTNRRRPQFWTQSMANNVIGGSMLSTLQTGTNPTWNQPLSSDSVVLNGAHYLQSFAFVNNGAVSVVVFNLNQTSALPITFSGPNAPSGNVQMTQITSANITDSNEFSNVVLPTTQTLSGFNPATGLSLPAFSMTVLTMTSSTVQAPSFSVAAGTYAAPQTVTITDTTPGATIYYTTDGTTPTTSSPVYAAPVFVSSNETIQAIATASSLAPSPVSSAAYVMSFPTAATPTFSVAAGQFATAQTVAIADTTAGAAIYYTTNGAVPTTSSTRYTGPITVSATETVNAIAAATYYLNSAVGSAAYTIMTPAVTPNFSVPAGTYTTAQTIALASATPGANIYYTTNGATPTVYSNKYTAPIKLSVTQTVQAFATATNYNNSAMASATYTINPATGTPVFSVASGTYSSAQTVTLTDQTGGAAFYYTTDGSTPTANSTKYTAPITVSKSETVNAIATATGYANSAVGSATYTISASKAAATPAFSIAAGNYTVAQTVSITDATNNATIYYTTNGTTPTTSSTKYTAPIKVLASETIKAIAVATNYTNSAVASVTYDVSTVAATPAFSVVAGTYSSAQTISITDATSGATVYYTTNGATPTTSSTKYTAPIKVLATETIKAIAVATNSTNSAVASATYTISTVAATPTFSVAAGTYTTAQSVSIADATSGATIYYTTNGTTPTTRSTKYAAAIKVLATETIKAIAVATKYTNSAVASATYTISPPSGSTKVATPTFSVPAGTYAASQSVSLADATSGTTIYYTTNGTTPTTSSTRYTSAIKVSATETITAIAALSSASKSAVATAKYTITPAATGGTGAFTAGEMVLYGSAKLKGTTIQLTDGGAAEIATAWSAKKVGVGSFTADFTFQVPTGSADGFTFTLQNDPKGTWASGGNGAALGYAGIKKSVAIKFDLYNGNNATEASATGLLQNGAGPATQWIDMSKSNVSLHTGHVMHAVLVYDGTTLKQTVTDTATKAVFTQSYAVNISSILGSTSGYIGFTASTGGKTAVQDILTLSYSGVTSAAKKK